MDLVLFECRPWESGSLELVGLAINAVNKGCKSLHFKNSKKHLWLYSCPFRRPSKIFQRTKSSKNEKQSQKWFQNIIKNYFFVPGYILFLHFSFLEHFTEVIIKPSKMVQGNVKSLKGSELNQNVFKSHFWKFLVIFGWNVWGFSWEDNFRNMRLQ